MMRARAVVFGAMAVATGCGGGDPFDGRDGRYDSPDDFDRTGCLPGSFDGYPPVGIYNFTRPDVVGIWLTGWPGSARMDAGRSGTLYGQPTEWAWTSDDDLFWYAPLPDDGSFSLDLCARDGDTVSGTYAFCNATDCYLSRAEGVKLARHDATPAQGLTLLGEVRPPGPAATFDLAVDGDLVYLATSFDGLAVVDATDPARPVVVGTGAVEYPDDLEYYNDVRLYVAGGRRYALMASSVTGVAVWDVTAPAAPVLAGHFGAVGASNDPPSVHTLYVDGTVAYLAENNRGLQMWDITDPRAAVPLFTTLGFPISYVHDLYVAGGRAYLASWGDGLQIVDVTTPSQPSWIGEMYDYGETSSHSVWVTQVGNRLIAAHGDEQWGAHLRLFDVTEGTAGFLTQVGEWQTRPEVSIHNLVAVGSEVFAAHYQDGVRIVDISDLSRPVETAWFNTWPGYDPRYGDSFFEGAMAVDLDPARGRVYVADSHRGLLILERTP